MFRENELDSKELNEEDVVQYEKKYHFAGVVKVLEDLSDETHVRYKVKVLDKVFGSYGKGDVFKFGKTRDESMWHYVNWKVKKIGSLTDYVNGDLKENKKRVNFLKNKYEDEKLAVN